MAELERTEDSHMNPYDGQDSGKGHIHDHNAKIETVKQSANSHDLLWSEVDILDNLTEMAHQVKRDKSFFGPPHAKALHELHQAQVDLALATITAEKNHSQAKYKELWEANDVENLRSNIFDQEYFDILSKHMNTVITKLDKVASSMKTVDEQNRDNHS